jgi:hypothetical protein
MGTPRGTCDLAAMFQREGDTMNTPSEIGARELDRRSNDGIEVALFWSPYTNRIWVALEDSRTDVTFELDVDPADALDAFHHPYAYLSRTYEPAIAA